MIFDRLRIRSVPSRLSECVVCNHLGDCAAFDHDLAALHHGKGEVCLACEKHVRMAELQLRKAQIAIPTDSILEGGSQP